MHLFLAWLWGGLAVLNLISLAMGPSLTQFNLVLAQSVACMFALRIYRNEERPY
mgnify:FL=1